MTKYVDLSRMNGWMWFDVAVILFGLIVLVTPDISGLSHAVWAMLTLMGVVFLQLEIRLEQWVTS